MANFCSKCGSVLNENENFCGSCGAPIDNHSIQNDATMNTNTYVKKNNNRLIGIIACLIAFAIVVVGLLAIFNRSEKPEVVIEKYLKASIDCDYETVCKYSAFNVENALKLALTSSSMSKDEIRERLLDRYGMTDIKKIYEGPIKDEIYEELKDEYGADYIIDISISGVTDLSKSEMESKIRSFREYYDDSETDISSLINLNKIKSMCLIRGKMSIEGSEDEDSDAFELYCVKIKGKWKVFGNLSSMFMF